MFKSIDDEDEIIENYFRQKLLLTLTFANENCRGSTESQVLSEAEKKDLFGQYAFWNKYQFQRGERKLIKAMVSYVKTVADSTEGDSKGLAFE